MTPLDLIAAAVSEMENDGTPLGALQGWLRMHAKLAEHKQGPTGWRYKCVEDLVLQAGTAYTPCPCPEDYTQGQLKECYTNSFVAAVSHSGLRYVEGYAMSELGLPMAHAWTITDDDQVVDLTWRWQDRDPKQHFYCADGALLGLVVPKALLWAVWKRRKYVGILDDWEHDFPALHYVWDADALTAHYKVLPLREAPPRRTRTPGTKRSERATA